MDQVLPNGIRLVDHCSCRSHSFCIGVYLPAGSMYEDEKQNGITHLFEHCVFRNIKGNYSENFYDLLSGHGLYFNACTYREFIQFEISGIPSGIDFAAEILAGIFQPLHLGQEDYLTELGRIKAEIREEDERHTVKALLINHVWKGTALANPITGRCGVLNRISRKQLEEYRKTIFFPGNVLVCLTGNIPQKQVQTIAAFLSGITLHDPQPHRLNIAPVPADFGKRVADVHVANGSFCEVALGFDIDNAKCPVGIRDLLHVTLFSGDNALFFRRLSEDKPLIYSYDARMEQYRNISSMQVSFEIDPGEIINALREIRVILKDICRGQFSFEVNLQKQLTQWQIQQDYVCEHNWAIAYDNYLLGGDPVYPDKPLMGRYEGIRKDDMVRCAADIFKKSNMTLAIRGPKHKIPRNQILEELGLFPD